MDNCKLTYVITTMNKLSMLKQVISRLLENIKDDEEIIVTDGQSTDGTVEYLQALHDEGKIQQFVSEPDCGEAHGFNKAFLMARGELIKVLTDDDVFYYPGIQECREFMLSHLEVDMLGTNGAGYQGHEKNPIQLMTYDENFEKYKSEALPFPFCGLGLMMRKSSLSKLGLFHTGFVRVDYEYALRATSLKKANIAWYTGFCWIRVANPQSNSTVYLDKMETEANRLDKLYLPEQEAAPPPKKGLAKMLNEFERSIRHKIKNRNKKPEEETAQVESPNFYDRIEEIFSFCDKSLNEYNAGRNSGFLIK